MNLPKIKELQKQWRKLIRIKKAKRNLKKFLQVEIKLNQVKA